MTPRAVDWSLAFVVWALFATGVLSLYTGEGASIFVAYGALGFALAALIGWKLRRVWRRVLGRHMVLGTLLVVVVLMHALLRRKPLRARDVAAGRRQFFAVGLVAASAYAAWQVQRPLSALVGLRGARRRFTGSFERGSFAGNHGLPATSWVADRPRVVDDPAYRLRVSGLVRSDLSLRADDIDAFGDSAEAVLDCTSGWYSRQRWSGARLDRLIARAGAREGARQIRVESHTGYRWSFPLGEASRLLLATRVGDEFLTHGHGAPARLVAPGRRGFQWVKWVVRIELIDRPDLGAPASTVWSSGTPEGRGEA